MYWHGLADDKAVGRWKTTIPMVPSFGRTTAACSRVCVIIIAWRLLYGV